MKHLAAYLLLTLAGKEAPSADDVSAVLAAAGIEGDAERLEKLVGDLNGKDINKLIADGASKLATMPVGGAAAPAAAAPAGGAAPAAAGGAAPAKEEKKEEEEEEEGDMGFGLFD